MKTTPVGLIVLVVVMGLLVLGAPATPCALAEPPPGTASGPAVSEAEAQALEDARRHVAAGGAVDASLGEGRSLLGWPAYPVTRLHDAVESGWLTVVRYLLDHGADPRAVVQSKSQYNQLRPTDIALLQGHMDILRMLRERGLPAVGYETTVDIDVGAADDALAFISLDEGRWARLDADNIGTTTAADFLISPCDRFISGLDGVHQNFKHVGDDTGVALLTAAQLPPGNRAPRSVTWRLALKPEDVRVGLLFLVRTSVGAVFRVELVSFDRPRGRCELRYARLATGTDGVGEGPVTHREAGRERPVHDASAWDAMVAAIAIGDLNTVQRMLRGGFDWRRRSARGRTILHAAVSAKQTDIANWILEYGMSDGEPGMPSADQYLDVHERLLDGADENGFTPLHLASVTGQPELVRVLLAQGAVIHAMDGKGRTALHLAALGDHLPVVQALVEEGARVRLCDARGNLPESLTSQPSLAGYLGKVAQQQPDPDERAVRALLDRLVKALRRGDRATLSRLLPPAEVAGLPDPLVAVAFTSRMHSFRLGIRDAEAAVVLTLDEPTPVLAGFRLTVVLAKDVETDTWRVRHSELARQF